MKVKTMMELLRNYRYNFFKKPIAIISSLFFVISLVLTIVGFYYYNYQKEIIVNDRFAYLTTISEFKKSQIYDWINSRYSLLEVIRVNSPLTAKLGTITLSRSYSTELKEWFDALKTLYKYDDIILVDAASKNIYSASSSNFKLNSIDSLQCDNAIVSDSIIFSDSDDKYTSKGVLKFYVPLGNSQDGYRRIRNVLILTADPNKIFNEILNNNFDKSPSLESLLVKPYLDGVVYLNSFKFINDAVDSNDNRKALIEANAIKSQKGFIDGVDYRNQNVIAVIQGIPSSAWTLMTKINKSEFYEPVNALAKLVFLAIISADLIFALVLFFLWRKSILANYKKMYAAEMEKSKLENRFETLVNGVKDIAIIILDNNGNIISWNEGAGILEGFTSEEVIGKNFSIFYSDIDKEKNKPAINLKHAKENGSYNEEGWRIKKDGSSFWANILITALKDDEGKIYGFLKITRDLTEKRKNEQELRNSRDFYLKLLNDFPTPVWRSGLDGKCNYFNKAWLNYTGKTIGKELGEGWTSNLHPDEKEKVITLYYEAFQQRTNFTLEFRLRNLHGEYRWMINFGMPYFDIENNFAGFLGSCYDIDDRKKYEETINTLLRIGEKLYSSLEINQIMDTLVTESIQLANAESGFACIKNENQFMVKRYYHKDHWEYFDKVYKEDENILNSFNSTREATVINNVSNKDIADQGLADKYDIRQIITTPLFGSNGELIGFFEIHNKKMNKGFSKEDANLLNAVARNASISMVKSLNYEQLYITEKQLRQSESELRGLAAQIQYAREAERQHIAREVHDELGQLFTGINLNISLLTELIEQNQKPSVGEILDELHSVQQFVNKGIQTVRDISGSLRSYVLDHLGLIPAVQEYCREIERMSNVKCNFNSEFESINYNDEKNVALFRIIQEAITNVLRHAEATTIDVTIGQLENDLEIIISDNGKGMNEDPGVRSNSMGILGMKERAIFLNGKLRIDSVKDKGTTIHLLVSLE